MTSTTRLLADLAIPLLNDAQKRRQQRRRFTPDFSHRAIWLSGLRVVAQRHSEKAANAVASVQGFVIYGLCMAAKAHDGYTASHGNAVIECAGSLCSERTLRNAADTALALGLLTWESTGKGRTGGMRTYYLGPALLDEAGKQFLVDGKAEAQRCSRANRKDDRDPELSYGPSKEDLELYGPCSEFVEEMQGLNLWERYAKRNRAAEASAEAEPASPQDAGPSVPPAEWRARIVEQVGPRVAPDATHEDLRVAPGSKVRETSKKHSLSLGCISSNHCLNTDLATSRLNAEEGGMEERDDDSQQDEAGMLETPCHSGRLTPPLMPRVQEPKMTKQSGTVYGVTNPLNLTEGDAVEVKEQRGVVSRYDWDRDEYLIIAESDDSTLGWFNPSQLTLLS